MCRQQRPTHGTPSHLHRPVDPQNLVHTELRQKAEKGAPRRRLRRPLHPVQPDLGPKPEGLPVVEEVPKSFPPGAGVVVLEELASRVRVEEG